MTLRKFLHSAAFLLTSLIVACTPSTPQSTETPTNQATTPAPPPTFTKNQFDLFVDHHITHILWTEATRTIVDNHQRQSLKIPMSQPDPHCARQLRLEKEQRPDLPPDSAMDCAIKAITSQPDSGWPDLTSIEREARSRRALNWVGKSKDPTTLPNLVRDSRSQNKPASEEDQILNILHNAFTSCTNSTNHITHLTEAKNHKDFATAWRKALQQADHCANRLIPKN